ncbi:hypothetical protein DYB28_010350, partial [Aphanomyces astaci]
SGRCVRTLKDAHSHFLTTLDVHPSLPLLVTGSIDKFVNVWESTMAADKADANKAAAGHGGNNVAQVVKKIEGHYPIWTRIVRVVWNFLVDLVLGTCELQRICSEVTKDTRGMMVKVRTNVALDRGLKDVQQDIFDFKPFDVIPPLGFNSAARSLTMNSCFIRFREVNEVYSQALALKDEAYDSTNDQHEVCVVAIPVSITVCIGRSMGLLALTQLVYYTEHYPVEARRSWLSNPTDLMAFPAVFGMLQETIRLELAERTYA